MYTCAKCHTEFMGKDLEYCAYCGKLLKYDGPLLSSRPLADLLKNGWEPILFRKWGTVGIDKPLPRKPRLGIPERAVP